MAEDIRVNGQSLSRLVSNVESLAGLLRTPQRRSQLVTVPGTHGKLGRPSPLFEDGRLSLPMWVIGVDPVTGDLLNPTDEGVTQFYAAANELAALFHQVPLHVEHELPDGAVWECWAEMVDDPLEFTRDLGSPLFGRVTVFLSVPAAFWRDQDEASSGPHSGTTGLEVQLAEFVGGSAPIDDMVVTFGPSNNPSLTQESTGLFVAYDGVIASGQKLVLDVGTWQVNQVAGHAGISGSLVWAWDQRSVRYHPDITRWWQLEPEPGGPTVRWAHTGGGSAAFAVQAHRKNLIG